MVDPVKYIYHNIINGSLMLRGRLNYILQESRGKKVLHIGCADNGYTEENLKGGRLFHSSLAQVAGELHGLDIEGIDALRKNGFENLYQANIEEPIDIGNDWDLIVVPEVLEHLSNPGLALRNIRSMCKPTTEVIFSVPNGIKLRFSEKVYQDHNCWYSPGTIRILLEKHGFKISDMQLYAYSRINIIASKLINPVLVADGIMVKTTCSKE